MSRQLESGSDIWLIEDHQPLRDTLAEALHISGSGQVEAFGSCEASLERLDVADLAPKVVIMDIGLPGMSGIEGLREFKSKSPASEIIMFTVFDDQERVLDAISAGASGYLLKSESLDRIVDAVEQVRNGGAPMTPEIARYVLDRFSRVSPRVSQTHLSDREREVLALLADGFIKKEIAARLDLSLHTVDNYMRRIYAKLHVNTIGGAVAKAIREGIL